MPGSLYGAPQVDLDQLDANAGALPIPNTVAYATTFKRAFNPANAVHLINTLGAGELNSERASLGQDPYALPTIGSDEANQTYGVPGYLRFNAPVSPYDAAFQQAQAKAKQFDDTVLSSTHPNPLINFGAGLAGGLVNPANLALMFSTDGFGEAAMGATGLKGGIEALTVGNKVGRAALSTVAEGALAQVPFVGANAAEAVDAGDDYSGGDALRDIATGAILHTGIHYGLAALRRGPGAAPHEAPAEGGNVPGAMPFDEAPIDRQPGPTFSPDPVPFVPDPVRDLPPTARLGAFAKALDDMAADRPVDVGQYVDRELNPPDLAKLDETGAAADIPSWRPLDDATAVTPRGTEVPVRYGLVELGDLVTSHDDNLGPNPDYPQELQPRDRERAGAQARNYQLESELNPKLLMTDVSAAAGTPIVAPDGVVESGNGRAIALRRSAERGTPAYDRYKAELAARGYDTTGMQRPVLVRMRTQPLEGAARASLAREMNADVTERMSATEQAKVDAGRISDADFDLIGTNEGPTTSRDFVRAFIAKVAPDQVNTLATAEGHLSPEGARRIKAAVLHRAYGDPRLVGQIFEGDDTPARKLGEALADAAPRWAQMRAMAARGDIPAEMDLTPALQSALDLIRHAAQEKLGLGELLADRLGQKELFGGEAISPFTEAFLRLFYKDEDMRRPEDGRKIAAALRDYVEQAKKVTPGVDLFGDKADENTARAILADAAKKFASGDVSDLATVRAPGRSDAGAEPRADPVVDLRRDGQPGDGAGSGVSDQAGAGDGGAVAEAAAEPAKPKRPTGEQLIAADPELKALQDDTARLMAQNGIEPPAVPDNQNPDTIADAIHAAAVCLAEEAE